MSTKRPSRDKKAKKQEHSEDISRFLRRGQTETIDVDEDPFEFQDEEGTNQTRWLRSGKDIPRGTNNNFQGLAEENMSEEEQIQKAIEESMLQKELDQERFAMCGNLSDVELTCSSRADRQDIQGSQPEIKAEIFEIIQSVEEERADSPDLFATPEDDVEMVSDAKADDQPQSPSIIKHAAVSAPTDFTDDVTGFEALRTRSLPAGAAIKKPQDFARGSKNRLKLHRTKGGSSSTMTTTLTSVPGTIIEHLKRRPLCSKTGSTVLPADDDDITDDETGPPSPVIPMESGRKKIIKGKNRSQKMVIDCDDEESSDSRKQGRDQVLDDSTSKAKKVANIILARKYKKAIVPIHNIKDAIRARLCRAPPGVDLLQYTKVIVEFLDHTRRRILEAQSRCKSYVKWGKPVVVGPRKGDTLDARTERKRGANRECHILKRIADEPTDNTSSKRSRRLINAQRMEQTEEDDKAPLSSTKPDSIPPKNCVDEGGSDDDLMRPALTQAGAKFMVKTEPGNKDTDMGEEFPNFDVVGQEQTLPNSLEVEEAQNVDHDEIESREKGAVSKTHQLNKSIETPNPVKTEAGKKDQTGKMSRSPSAPVSKSPEQGDCSGDIGRRSVRKRKHRIIEDDLSEDEEQDEVIMVEGPAGDSGRKLQKTADNNQHGHDNGDEEDFLREELTGGKKKASAPGSSLRAASKHSAHLLHDSPTSPSRSSSSTPGLPKSEVPLKQPSSPSALSSSIGPPVSDVTLDGSSIPLPKPKRTDAALKASKAALQPFGLSQSEGSDSQEVCGLSPTNTKAQSPGQGNPSMVMAQEQSSAMVNCPICFHDFPADTIQNHAATCEPASSSTAVSPVPARNCVSSPVKDNMRDLRVVVQRSPQAERMKRRAIPTRNARRNISYGDSQSSSEPASQSQNRSSSPVNIPDDGDHESQRSWLDNSSQKRNKFSITYGGKGKKERPNKALQGEDFIPLSELMSGDEEGDNEEATGTSHEHSGSLDSRPATASSSDSDPDAKMLANYGIQISPRRKNKKMHAKTNTETSPNRHAEKNVEKGSKRSWEDHLGDNDFENELALGLISGALSKESAKKAKRARATRAFRPSDSSPDDDSERCFLCDQMIPVEQFAQHSDMCLRRKGASTVTPGKTKRKEIGPTSKSSSTLERMDYEGRVQPCNERPPPPSGDVITMNPREISDSPIKTFTLIGENSESNVDFDNQFSFFNAKRPSNDCGGRHRGRGKSRGKRGFWKRGRGRGRR
ncbi:uncharacterized protein LOC5506662 [Nematostella vectensis]|uniref:uncharacterized protein LOC5506662 n=1 Tax=Nematostella vectensis TaxID=45351 RepID=UPI0020776E8F|nr:uncharacterized protein LOC5506662 [Nematostella vectensis]